MEKQNQHFVPEFLLKNFTDKSIGKYSIHKFENGKWEVFNISNTGNVDLLYGSKCCSLEVFYSDLENIIAAIINKHLKITEKDKAYMKIFIFLMAFRSPSKNQILSNKYKSYIKSINKKFDNEQIYSHFENSKEKYDNFLETLEEDYVLKEIVNNLLTSFDDSDNLKFYPILTTEILQLLPKFGKTFDVHIFESDHDLIIGETPTISVNLATNEVKTNGEEAGLIGKNIMYWIPISSNRVAFMYKSSNIIAIEDRKLRKYEVDILNYFQSKKSSFFYSRTQNINIPELPCDFNWVKHFNYILGYKNKLLEGKS